MKKLTEKELFAAIQDGPDVQFLLITPDSDIYLLEDPEEANEMAFLLCADGAKLYTLTRQTPEVWIDEPPPSTESKGGEA